MEIVLLGTGAALPTLHRWPASAAIIRQGEILLFDCGEGIQLQFLKAGLRPGKLNRIFLSHFHGDHFNGLIGFLTSLQLGGRQKKLHLYGPQGLTDYIQYMQQIGHFEFQYPLAVNEVSENERRTSWDCGDYQVISMPLEHRIFTLGFRIEEKPLPGKFDAERAEEMGIPSGPLRARLKKGETITLQSGQTVTADEIVGPPKPGKKVAICVDTRPCANSIELASEVDLLIHEGTFDAEKAELAKQTKHSTVVEAAQTAKEAYAKKMLLTHLSARYLETDEPRLLQQASTIFSQAILGHDLMRLQI